MPLSEEDRIDIANALKHSTLSHGSVIIDRWHNKNGEKVLMLASRGTSRANCAIGRDFIEPNADSGEHRHVFADWIVKDNKVHINLYSNPTEKQTLAIDITQPSSKVAELVATQLESAAIHPIHAKAIFEAVAQTHVQSAHGAFKKVDGTIESLLEDMNPDFLQRGGALSLQGPLEKLHAATNPLGKAVEILRYEALIKGIKDAKTFAQEIRDAIPRDKASHL